MKPKALIPALSPTRNKTAPAAKSPSAISRRDLRVAARFAQAFGCPTVMPAKSPRN